MAEDNNSLRGRRPPRLANRRDEGSTTEENFPAVGGPADAEEEETLDQGPIHQELARRGLPAEPDPNEPVDLSEDSDALVFDEQADELADSAPTFVGELPIQDEPAAGEAPVEKTEILQVAAPEQADYPVLTIETADGQASDVEVVKDRFVLGRSPECDVVIPDSLISRQHAVIEKRIDGWYVVDQNSGNGSFLNDERIREELLYDGDVLGLGDALVTFTAPGSAADQAPRLDATQMLPAAAGGEGTSVTGALAGSPARAKRKKLLIIAGAVVVLIGVLGIAKKLSTPPPPKGPTPAQVAAQKRQQAIAQAEQDFEQVKELVKQEKWQEARPKIQAIAQVVPEAKLVQEYKDNIEREAKALDVLDKARKLADQKEYEAAVIALAEMPADSLQAKAAEELKKTIDDSRMTAKLEQANAALADKRWEDALAVADELLQAYPDNEAATDIKRQALKEMNKPKPPPRGHKRRKRVHTPHPPPRPKFLLAGKSLELYKAEQVDQALSQASSSGVSAEGVKTLRSFQSLYKQGKELARNPGQAPRAIKFLVKSVQLDKKLSGGHGQLTDNLKKATAKAYFLQGVDAHTRQKYPLAYQAFSSALKYNPGLDQARKRLRDLEQEAKKLFETAYVIKSSSPEKAVSHCQTVMGMIQKSNVYYGKCKKLIEKIRGPLGSSGEGGEGF